MRLYHRFKPATLYMDHFDGSGRGFRFGETKPQIRMRD